MKLDRGAFLAAFARVAPRLAAPPFDLATSGDAYRSIPFFRDTKYGDLPGTVEELIEDSLDDDALANFVTTLVLRELGPVLAPRRIPRSAVFEDGDFTLVRGDLHVAGNLAYTHPVLVLGDLAVDGLIEDRFEGSPLLVAGSVRARGLYLGSQTKIAGSLAADDVVHLRFTRGGDTLFVGGGARTRLYVMTRDDSRFTGTMAAELEIDAYPGADDPALAPLRERLAIPLDDSEPRLTAIIATLRDLKPLWR